MHNVINSLVLERDTAFRLVMSSINMALTTLLTAAIGLALLYLIKTVFDKKRIAPLPPGPPPRPIIGNLADLPSPGQQDWVHWLKLKDTYGEAGFTYSSIINYCRSNKFNHRPRADNRHHQRCANRIRAPR